MSALTDEISKLIDNCTEAERRAVLSHLRERTPLHALETEWSTTAEAILTAIARSSDLTQRGIRGILAEAAFEEFILPQIGETGWKAEPISGDHAYDFLLERMGHRVSVQVKLQRREAGAPKEYGARARAALNCPTGPLYVVEVQKTRSGSKKGVKTRPYRFGDFDILAVSLHPTTGDWRRFMYTVGSWLLSRPNEPELIEIFQPVPAIADDYWSDDLGRCIGWFLAGQRKRLYP